MKQRALTEAECEELQELKSAVYRAEFARDEWLRRKGHEVAAFREGDEIWDLGSFVRLGIVTSLVVGLSDHGDPYVDYWYRTSDPYEGTLSTKDLKCRIGTHQQARLDLREKLKRLEAQ